MISVHFVVGLLSLLADKGCATLFNNDVAVRHRYLSPIIYPSGQGEKPDREMGER
jgi:hypothetical protein